MKCYIDLHIHSVLSPCADLIMTSKPIISKLKKIIFIFLQLPITIVEKI